MPHFNFKKKKPGPHADQVFMVETNRYSKSTIRRRVQPIYLLDWLGLVLVNTVSIFCSLTILD